MSEYIDIEILKKKINSSSGYQITQEMNSLNDSVRVLNANYVEIKNHLQNFQKDYKKINGNSLHPNLKTKRLIHNYLASSISLVDHTRIHIKLIHKEKEFSDYQPMIEKTFIKNPLCVFIKDFRQYLQHYRLPEISFQAYAFNIKLKWSIIISTSELEKFSGWKKESKVFIKNKNPRLDLLDVAENYQNVVNDFYNWFTKTQKEIFSEEIKKFEQLKIEMKNLKISYLTSNLILNIYKSFYAFEKELYLILSKEEKANIKNLIQVDKINKIIEILNLDNVIKNVVRHKLEQLE